MPKLSNRWIIALTGAWLQLFLGTVYAWSYFQQPLVQTYRWSNTEVAWAFSFAICFVGLAAAWGGTKLPIYGPRKLAVIGSILFGGGYLLAATALHWRSLDLAIIETCQQGNAPVPLLLRWRSLALLYLGYGIIGGSGLGLGYVTPVATVAKWFPDKKGLATGLVIMGFGFGPLLLSKILAPALCDWANGDLETVFASLGVIFMAATVLAASGLRNPPADYMPHVFPARHTIGDCAGDGPGICSWRFAVMWTIFFCNILAGISIISFQSPIFQDLWRRLDPTLSTATLASYGATLIGVSALFNGCGRMFWGALSDRIGRLPSFRLMLASQLAVFWLLVVLHNPWLFGALICYVLLCYGGGFGTMPSFILDVFGAKKMAQAYGAILTAWSAGGIVGPQVVALLKDHFRADSQQAATVSFLVGAGFLVLGLLLSFALRKRRSAEA